MHIYNTQNNIKGAPSWSFTDMAAKGQKQNGTQANDELRILKSRLLRLTTREMDMLLSHNSRKGKIVVTIDEYMNGGILLKKFYGHNQN